MYECHRLLKMAPLLLIDLYRHRLKTEELEHMAEGCDGFAVRLSWSYIYPGYEW